MYILHELLAQSRYEEIQQTAAARGRYTIWKSEAPEAQPVPITIRHAWADDAPALERLATLDSRKVPAAPVLVAELDGRLCAALSLTDGQSVADPFMATAAVLQLL